MTQSWINNFSLSNSFTRDSQSETSTHDNAVAAVTPQYMISCPKLFRSEVEGASKSNDMGYKESSAPCSSFEVRRDRRSTYDSSGENSGDGRMTLYNTIVLMRYGYWAPLIQYSMDHGDYIERIHIERLSSINNTQVVIQELHFEQCTIKTYMQKEDMIIFSFNFTKLFDYSHHYKTNGEFKGTTAVDFNILSVTGSNK